MSLTKRVYPRHYYNGPIKYSQITTDDYIDSRMYNFSKGGIYFEPSAPLKAKSDIGIVMLNYSPGSYGPDSFKFYIARIKWCKEIKNGNDSTFGAGAQFLSRSHEIQSDEIKAARYTCDLCGRLTPLENIHQTEKAAFLCLDCFKHFKSIPANEIRVVIERFLIGNVI